MNIVVLHGWGQNSEYWQEISSKFDNSLTLDLPGFGNTPLIDSNWGIANYASWVVNQIESKGLKNVVLVGHSFGGRIASYVASQNPEWLNLLVLYGAPCIYRPSLSLKMKTRLFKILKNLGIKKKPKNSELNIADSNGMGKIFRKAVVFDQTEILPKIKVPTLLIWGEKDFDVPLSIAKEMHTLIPKSQLVVLNNLGHNAHLENPNLFYGTIKNFIQNN